MIESFASLGMVRILCSSICWGFGLMAFDKSCARRGAWRIPERVLFGVALLGGSAGTWAGMYLCRHKTRHWYFVVGMPLILAAQIWLAGGAGL